MAATWNANCTDHCSQHTSNFEAYPVVCRGGAAWKLPGMLTAQITTGNHTSKFETHPVVRRGGAAWKLPGMPAAQIIAASTHQILKHVLLLVGVELHGSYLEC